MLIFPFMPGRRDGKTSSTESRRTLMADPKSPRPFKSFLAKAGAAFLAATLAAGLLLFGLPLKSPEPDRPDAEAPAAISSAFAIAEDAPTSPTLSGAAWR
jgi:hypothetical protein